MKIVFKVSSKINVYIGRNFSLFILQMNPHVARDSVVVSKSHAANVAFGGEDPHVYSFHVTQHVVFLRKLHTAHLTDSAI